MNSSSKSSELNGSSDGQDLRPPPAAAVVLPWRPIVSPQQARQSLLVIQTPSPAAVPLDLSLRLPPSSPSLLFRPINSAPVIGVSQHVVRPVALIPSVSTAVARPALPLRPVPVRPLLHLPVYFVPHPLNQQGLQLAVVPSVVYLPVPESVPVPVICWRWILLHQQ